MNLEAAVTPEMLALACRIGPADVCLVPERRAEVTTEGGLDVAGQTARIKDACEQLRESGIRVSLFIDADTHQIEAAQQVGADAIELHTGAYAGLLDAARIEQEIKRLQQAAQLGRRLGLVVNAGHGLTLENLAPVAAMEEIGELNIGHALVAHALFVGLAASVRDFKKSMIKARSAAHAR